MKKIALVTMSYKADLKECDLLCKSIDKFAPDFDHFIFVNDEDIHFFDYLNSPKRKVIKKTSILPWYFIRLPFRILNHHFYISPISLPMREWIMQQICKLGVFEVIGNKYDAVLNVDSETVIMKHIDYSTFYKNGKYRLFRSTHTEYEVAHNDYINAIGKFFNNAMDLETLRKWNYMDMPVCFVRENLNCMLSEIKKNSPLNNWKAWMASTYRFSENYTYGNYVVNTLNMRYHYYDEKNVFPVVHMSNYESIDEFSNAIRDLLNDSSYFGFCLQKPNRNKPFSFQCNFDSVVSVIKSYWNK